jgi:hypothetical protein
MQPVLRLLEDPAPRAVHHVVRDLLAAVRRETVHHHGVGRHRQEVPVDLVRGEGVAALLGLGLLPHRGPGVRVHDRGALDDGARILVEHEPPAVRGRQVARLATIRSFGP